MCVCETDREREAERQEGGGFRKERSVCAVPCSGSQRQTAYGSAADLIERLCQ